MKTRYFNLKQRIQKNAIYVMAYLILYTAMFLFTSCKDDPELFITTGTTTYELESLNSCTVPNGNTGSLIYYTTPYTQSGGLEIDELIIYVKEQLTIFFPGIWFSRKSVLFIIRSYFKIQVS